MTIMETVNRIKTDIENLPTEYQKLIVEEKTFAQAHPLGIAVVAFAAGWLGHGVVSMALGVVGHLLF